MTLPPTPFTSGAGLQPHPGSRPTRRLGVAAGLLATAGAGLTGCGQPADPVTAPTSQTSKTSPTPSSSPTQTSSPSTATATTSPASTTSPIVIKNFAYRAATGVGAGATVSVRNDDNEAHTVTADTGSAFDVTIQPGQTVTFTAPAKAGRYAYHCLFHANMHGSLAVG